MVSEKQIAFLKACSSLYENDLKENILPFWLKYGVDKKNGGYYTCVDRDGSLIDSMKSIWFQGRGAYIFANAYNTIEARAEWLDAAKSGIDFLEKYGADASGRYYFEVTATGEPVRQRRYVFSETFAAIAFAEYAIATQNSGYAEKALALFKEILRFIRTPEFLPAKYEPAFAAKGHSICMILINTAARIRAAINDTILNEQIDQSVSEIKQHFLKPQFKALLEMVGSQGEFIDSINGRIINPGHCIETSWFIMEEARFRNWDTELKDLALTILDWSWDWGWDKEYGGIINFRDCKNLPPQDYAHDMKFWWPQTEAVIANLYAFLATGDEKYLHRHKLIHDYTYAHFPDSEYGEWYGYLHRDGSVSQPAKGNIFKGPFHIPRMMIKGKVLCDEIILKYGNK